MGKHEPRPLFTQLKDALTPEQFKKLQNMRREPKVKHARAVVAMHKMAGAR